MLVDADALDSTVDFHNRLLRGEKSLRFDDPNAGLRLALAISGGFKMRYGMPTGLSSNMCSATRETCLRHDRAHIPPLTGR